MDPVLDDPGLGHQLKEKTGPARCLNTHGRVVLRIVDAVAAQPLKLGFVVGGDVVVVEGGGPEAGDRCGMPAVEDNLVNTRHSCDADAGPNQPQRVIAGRPGTWPAWPGAVTGAVSSTRQIPPHDLPRAAEPDWAVTPI